MCPFLTYQCISGGFCTQMMIFKNCTSFCTLKGPFFDKPPYCTSKLCNSFLSRIRQKRQMRGFFQDFEDEICLEK